MPEAPEIPEAKDPFEKRAAVTIAILAVVLAIFGNRAENARTEAIIKTNEAADQWAFFQAKGIKGNIATAEQELLTLLAPSQNPAADVAENAASSAKSTAAPSSSQKAAAEIAKNAERLKTEAERYKTEQEEPKKDAKKAEKDAALELKISERCERGLLALQVAIVLASVSILARSHAFWIASIVLGLIGIGVGVTAFML